MGERNGQPWLRGGDAAAVTVPPRDAAAGDPDKPLVLVVDDNHTNQKVAALMLRQLGYQVDVAADGGEAVDAVRRMEYAAVLMDCQMPGMDGYKATAQIRRRQASGRRTPIIAMTAGAMQGDEERALEAGMDDFLTKPVAIADLGAVLGRWTGAARVAPSRRPAAPAPAAPAPVAAKATEAAPPSSPVLDARILAGLHQFESEGPPGMLQGLVALFLDTTRDRLSALDAAVTTGDLTAAAGLAHSLRGSCANLAATGMAATAQRLEQAAGAGDMAGVDQAMRAMVAELEEVDVALRAAFPGPP